MKKETIADMARRRGISPQVVYSRMHSGWTLAKALSTPVRIRKPRKKAKPAQPESLPLVDPEKQSSGFAAALSLLAAMAVIGWFLAQNA
jgi:hypothetical protein